MTDRSHDARNDEWRQRLIALVAGLDAAALGTAVDDTWTVAALLGHLAFWDGLVAQRWQLARREGQPTPIGLDEALTDLVNAAGIPAWRALDASRAGEVATAAAEGVDRLIAGLADESIEGIVREGRPRLLDRSLHRAEHVAMIEAALAVPRRWKRPSSHRN